MPKIDLGSHPLAQTRHVSRKGGVGSCPEGGGGDLESVLVGLETPVQTPVSETVVYLYEMRRAQYSIQPN